MVDYAFSPEWAGASGVNTGLATLLFALQIYGDFSGYSDIARGSAKLMGFDLMVNFKKPYLVCHIRDLWSHWHISLSSWLRDYLYIPLGGNRGRAHRVYRNLFLTMCLGGLWHGANWAFVLWGVYHGMLLAIGRAFGSEPKTKSIGGRLWATSWIFLLVCLGWFVFRLGGLSPDDTRNVAWNMLSQFGGGRGVANGMMPYAALTLFSLATVFLCQSYWAKMEEFSSWPSWCKQLSTATAMLAVLVFGYFENTQFIYFQF